MARMVCYVRESGFCMTRVICGQRSFFCSCCFSLAAGEWKITKPQFNKIDTVQFWVQKNHISFAIRWRKSFMNFNWLPKNPQMDPMRNSVALMNGIIIKHYAVFEFRIKNEFFPRWYKYNFNWLFRNSWMKWFFRFSIDTIDMQLATLATVANIILLLSLWLIHTYRTLVKQQLEMM